MLKTNSMAYAELVAALLEGGHTFRELAEASGLHYVTVLQHVAALRKRGVCHIHAWEEDALGRLNVAQFKLGPGRTAAKPKLTGAQRQQRQRDKKAAIRKNLVMAGKGAFVKSANGGFKFIEKGGSVDRKAAS